MTKNLQIPLWLMLALLVGCAAAQGDVGAKFLGKWHGPKYDMVLTKDGTTFIATVTRTTDWQGIQGKHTAKLVDGALVFDITLLGRATLSSDGQRIIWAGDEWQRARSAE